MTDTRPFLAGVTGWPVSHSKSPRIFRYWFEQHGLMGDYVRLPIAVDDFSNCVRALARCGFRGLNVTVPHKETALAIADTRSTAAESIGASNTLVFGADGSIHADNSDGFGFIENLRAGAPDWSGASGPALVLGAGGAARAIIHALLEANVPEILLVNRTNARAEGLAEAFGERVSVEPWDDRAEAAAGAAVIVNTTSLGMIGQPPLDLSLAAARPGTVVNDIVYAPLMTPLLTDAAARGLPTVTGIGMLLHQARLGFRHWFGPDPTVDDTLRDKILAD